MQKYIYILLFLLSPIYLISQIEGRYLGNSYNDEVFSVVSDKYNNFYIVGSQRTFSNDFEKVCLYKIDDEGNEIFNVKYGEGYRNRAFNLIILQDNNLLICGESWGGFGSDAGRRDVFLLKTDRSGKEIWSKDYYNYHRDQAFSVKELKNSNIILIGYSKSFDNGENSLGDVYIMKTDSKGEILWENSFNDNGNDYGFDIIEKDNGNYLLLCTSGGFYNSNQFDYRVSHDSEIMLIETDTYGNELNRKYWGTDKHDFGKEIIRDVSGTGFYVIGSTQSFGNGSFDMLLLKIDNNGNEQWFRTYGNSNFDYGISLDLSKNEEFIFLCGTAFDDISETTKLYIIKTDLLGNEIWSQELGNENLFAGKSIKALNDGGCIVVATTTNFSQNNTNNIFVQRFDENGKMKFDSNELFGINIYPNPVSKVDKITFEITLQNDIEDIKSVEIYDINSKLIEIDSFRNKSWAFSPSKLRTGVYFYKIYSKEDILLTGKFIVY